MLQAIRMPAFDLAVQAGADVLETDIHWTKDQVAVMCHDGTVDIVSNGHGPICNMTLNEIKKLDFGYRFSLDGGVSYPFRGKGIEIPTLAEVLLRYPMIRINIDVKPKYGIHIGGLIRELEYYGALARVGLASFHHQVLLQIRNRCPDISTSASPREVAQFILSTYMSIFNQGAWPFDTLQVPPSQYGIRVITARFMEGARKQRIPVHVWTIDNGDQMSHLVKQGVSGIVTNCPKLAVQVVRNKG